ncbi:MAG: MBL fold metallo-hydrolase [Candidatus Omnitrophica bacterium]|nr:MBL fold metallo-hydrolase [Candidatus Omnitrophota bacterium]
MIKQLRASAGIWFSLHGTNFIVDPGPGTIVRVNKTRPKLPLDNLDAIYLSHRHLDHSGDVNVMIEVMTDGGFKKRGTLLCPEDALKDDPVVFQYTRKFLDKIEILIPGVRYKINNVEIETGIGQNHGCETYGFKIYSEKIPVISYIPDTEYFPHLVDYYKNTDILIISVVFYEKREGILHMCLSEALNIISAIKPGKAVLTHFGMSMLKNKIWEKEEEMKEKTGVDVIAAYDGMTVDV